MAHPLSKLFLFLLIFFATPCLAQDSIVNIDEGEPYVVELKFINKVQSEKVKCYSVFSSKNGRNKKQKVHLYSVNINKVFLQRDHSVYEDTIVLKQVQYMAMVEKTGRIILDSSYLLTATNSAMKEYLLGITFSEHITNGEKMKFHYLGNDYFSDLIDCYKRLFFSRSQYFPFETFFKASARK